MKVLNFTLLTMALLVLVFLSLGYFSPEIRYESSLSINARVEKVWAVMTDNTMKKAWVGSLKGSEQLSGHKDTLGSVYKRHMQGGEAMNILETITEFDENERLGFRLDNKSMLTKTLISLEGSGEETLLRAYHTTRGKNLIDKSTFFLLKGMMKRRADKEYAALKTLIESTDQSQHSPRESRPSS